MKGRFDFSLICLCCKWLRSPGEGPHSTQPTNYRCRKTYPLLPPSRKPAYPAHRSSVLAPLPLPPHLCVGQEVRRCQNILLSSHAWFLSSREMLPPTSSETHPSPYKKCRDTYLVHTQPTNPERLSLRANVVFVFHSLRRYRLLRPHLGGPCSSYAWTLPLRHNSCLISLGDVGAASFVWKAHLKRVLSLSRPSIHCVRFQGKERRTPGGACW